MAPGGICKDWQAPWRALVPESTTGAEGAFLRRCRGGQAAPASPKSEHRQHRRRDEAAQHSLSHPAPTGRSHGLIRLGRSIAGPAQRQNPLPPPHLAGRRMPSYRRAGPTGWMRLSDLVARATSLCPPRRQSSAARGAQPIHSETLRQRSRDDPAIAYAGGAQWVTRSYTDQLPPREAAQEHLQTHRSEHGHRPADLPGVRPGPDATNRAGLRGVCTGGCRDRSRRDQSPPGSDHGSPRRGSARLLKQR